MVRSIFLVIIFLLIFLNFTFLFPHFIDAIHILKTHQVRSIERKFSPLIPYLKGVRWVGYMTCLNSSHPLTDVAIMGPYQLAQFVLSPTILDYYHPLDYQYIIYQCPKRIKQTQGTRKPSNYVNLKTFDGVSLLFRKKVL
jgi:hypothetical protein